MTNGRTSRLRAGTPRINCKSDYRAFLGELGVISAGGVCRQMGSRDLGGSGDCKRGKSTHVQLTQLQSTDLSMIVGWGQIDIPTGLRLVYSGVIMRIPVLVDKEFGIVVE